jgi:hypothetical protein
MSFFRYILSLTLIAGASLATPLSSEADEIFANSNLPVGIYRFQVAGSNKSCHIFVLETGSIGQAAYVAEIPTRDTDFVSYVPFWRGRWNSEQRSFEAIGSNLRDVNLIRLNFGESDELRGTILSTNPSVLCTPNTGRMGEEIPFQAGRIAIEKELIELANQNSMLGRTDPIEVEGRYRGSIGTGGDRINIELRIRSLPRDGSIVWFATMTVGELTTIPLISAPSNHGLLRLMRSSGPIPGEISGLTGAAIRCRRGECPDPRIQNGIEFRGLFFVPRNGRITPIRLQKID